MYWGNLGLDTLNPFWFYESLSLKLPPTDLPYTPDDDLDNDKLQEKFRRLSSERQSSVVSDDVDDKEQKESVGYLMASSLSLSRFSDASRVRGSHHAVDSVEEDEISSGSSSPIGSEFNDAQLDISANGSSQLQPDLTIDVPARLTADFPDRDPVIETQPTVDVAALRETVSQLGMPLDLSHDLNTSESLHDLSSSDSCSSSRRSSESLHDLGSSDSCSSSRRSSAEEQALTNINEQSSGSAWSRSSYTMRRPSLVKSPELDTIVDLEEDSVADDEADSAKKERDKKISGVSEVSCDSCMSVSETPSRKSASVGSTASYTLLLSEVGSVRRLSEPDRLPSCLQKPFVCGKSTVDLQGVECLEAAVSRLKKVALEMRNREQNTTISNQEDGQSQTKGCISRRSKSSNAGLRLTRLTMRRMSCCDSMGLPLEPINVDVGMVRQPAVRRGRRRSLAGTFSGVDLPLTKPNAVPGIPWMPESMVEPTVRPFSPRMFVHLLRGRETSRDQVVEEEAFACYLPPTPPANPHRFRQTILSPGQSPTAVFEGRFRYDQHAIAGNLPDGGSGLTTPADSEDDADSRGPSTPANTPRRKLSVLLEKPRRPLKTVQFIDISANGIESVSSLTADAELLKKLKDVSHLDLSQNKLSEFPATLGQCLSSLTHLSICYNDFASLPGHLLAIPRLQDLQASHNRVFHVLPCLVVSM